MQLAESLHDRQAEQFVLGAMMTDSATVALIAPLLGEAPDIFFTTDHDRTSSSIINQYQQTIIDLIDLFTQFFNVSTFLL